MTCQQFEDRIDALASGDEVQTGETRAHLESCHRCQAAFARAVQIEQLLASRPSPSAPPGFTSRVTAAVRHASWESEQSLDRWFNVAVAVSILLAACGVWLLANVSGMAAVGADAGRLLRDGATLAAERFGGNAAVYFGATLVLLFSVAVWSWAEQN
jgi:anti-sigma factor RsiW